MIQPDGTTATRLDRIYPDVKVRWIRLQQSFYDLHGMQLRVAQGLRTAADQQLLYEKGRTLVGGAWQFTDPVHRTGVVTYAKPGDSWHNYGVAIDSCFWGADPFLANHPDAENLWAEHARFAEAFGFESGYRWPAKQDKPHVELRHGLTLAEVKEIFLVGGLPGVWHKFDQIQGLV